MREGVALESVALSGLSRSNSWAVEDEEKCEDMCLGSYALAGADCVAYTYQVGPPLSPKVFLPSISLQPQVSVTTVKLNLWPE